MTAWAKTLLTFAGGAVLFTACCSGESFDVASIRPSTIGKTRAIVDRGPDSVSLTNASISDLLQWAFDVKYFQISEGKQDLGRFDIRAKSQGPADLATLRRMLQDLLATRFHLVLHREMRPVSVYEMVAAKGGPKLPPTKDEPAAPHRATESLPRVQDGHFLFFDTSLSEFAAKLSLLRGIDRPIVNKTEIKGNYDITLKSAASMIREGDETSLFSLIQNQLGLKLVPAKAPMEFLVVDSVDRPSAN